MKKFMTIGLALAEMVGASQAMAQTYDSPKGHDQSQLMQDMQRSEVETNVQPPPQQAARVSQMEPVARDSYSSNFSGPYIGGDIGYSWGNYDVTDPAGPDGEASVDGWEGGLLAGYGYTPDFMGTKGYAGIELGYEWSGADDDVGANSFEKDHSWLVTFRPGVVIMDDTALGYGIVGYNRGTFENNGEEESLNGLVLGAGAEFDTGMPVRMRLEYAYTNYEDGDFSGVSFDGHENNLKAGLVYRF